MKNSQIVWLFLVTTFLVSCKQSEEKQTDKKQQPNILFAIMDDATYMHMGAYGCSWVKTPNFDRVAKNGLLFNRAYTPNAKCAPSRSNILTGRNSWQLEQAANHWPYFPQKFRTFAEVLANNDYHVGYTGKGWAPGVAKNADGSKRQLLVKQYSKLKTVPPTPKISKVDYAANFNAFLKDNNKNQPFFFWYGGLEPHRGYEYGSGIAKGGKSVSQISDNEVYDFWPAVDSVKTDMLDYAYEIEYFDKQLGKMLKTLEERGELNNTLVVITSDNGMPFPRIKGQEYEYSNHLPLAIMWADGIAHTERKIDDYISFIDFAPTFLELAGVASDKNDMQPITGKSFVDILRSAKDGQIDSNRNHVLIGKERHDIGRPNDEGYPIRGLVKNNMLYLHNFKIDRWPAGNPETGYLNTDGSPTKTFVLNTVYADDDAFYFWKWNFGKRQQKELYDLTKDPDCLVNLASNDEHSKMLLAMHEELFNRLKKQQDPRVNGNGDIFDNYRYADTRGVNFYDRYMAKDSKLSWGWVKNTDFQDLSKVKRVQESIGKTSNIENQTK